MNEQVMSVDDFLAHHGVKGMKWGVHKARDNSGGGGGGGKSAPTPKKKQSVGQKIGAGVAKVGARDQAIEQARINMIKKDNELHKARKDLKRSTKMFSAERKAGKMQLHNMKMDIMNHPDQVTANRLTSGEIIANAMFNKGLNAAQNDFADKIQRRQQTGYYTSRKK